MKQITLKVEENNFQTFLRFLETLDYVKIAEKENIEIDNSKPLKKSLAGALSKESADLLVKHGQDIRNEWERNF